MFLGCNRRYCRAGVYSKPEPFLCRPGFPRLLNSQNRLSKGLWCIVFLCIPFSEIFVRMRFLLSALVNRDVPGKGKIMRSPVSALSVSGAKGMISACPVRHVTDLGTPDCNRSRHCCGCGCKISIQIGQTDKLLRVFVFFSGSAEFMASRHWAISVRVLNPRSPGNMGSCIVTLIVVGVTL